jgi:hypothetical protein
VWGEEVSKMMGRGQERIVGRRLERKGQIDEKK